MRKAESYSGNSISKNMGGNMAESDEQNSENEEPIPVMQQLLDNPFLLLFIGVTIPTIFYVIWGVMEIVAIPIAK
jgi:hypothetical protein